MITPFSHGAGNGRILPGFHLDISPLRLGRRFDSRGAIGIPMKGHLVTVLGAGASDAEKKTDKQSQDGDGDRHQVGDDSAETAWTAMTAVRTAVCVAGKGAATFTASDDNHDLANWRMLARFANRGSSSGYPGVGEAISESKWRINGKSCRKTSLPGGSK